MHGLRQTDRVSTLDWGTFYPTQREKNKWIKAMRSITVGNTSRLLQGLGKWLGQPSWREEWRWLPGSDQLAKQMGNEWRIFSRVTSPNGTRSNRFEYTSSVCTIPVHSYKASTYSLGIDLY